MLGDLEITFLCFFLFLLFRVFKNLGITCYYNQMLLLNNVYISFHCTEICEKHISSTISEETMTEERINALILLFVHKDTQLDYSETEIDDLYAKRHLRQMILSSHPPGRVSN